MSLSSQRYVSTSIWDEDWYYDLNSDARLAFMYLLTSRQSNAAGVYECTLSRMARDLEATREDVRSWLDAFSAIGKAYYVDGYVIIPWAPTDQRWNERSKIKDGIERTLKSLPESILAALKQYDYEYPLDQLFDEPKESEKEHVSTKETVAESAPAEDESSDEALNGGVVIGAAPNGAIVRQVDRNGSSPIHSAPSGANPSSLDFDSDLDLVNTSPSESGKPPPQKLSALKNPKANAWQTTLIEEQHWDNIPAERRACGTLADRGDLLLADLPPPAQADLAQLGDGDVHTGIARVALDVLHSQKAAEKQKAGSNPFWVGTPETPMGILGKWKWLKQLIIDKTKSSKSEHDRLIAEVLGYDV